VPLSAGVKKQLRISAWILVAYGVTLLIYLQNDIQEAFMTGTDESVSETAPFSEYTWEILVTDPELRLKLWSRFDHSSQKEKEKAFLAVVHMLDAINPEQAEHLAENMIERSGNAPDRQHRKRLLDMLERLGPRFKNALKFIARFSAKSLSSPLESRPRREDIKNMMDNIARETKDTAYKYCMRGQENEVKRCTEQMVTEKHPNFIAHLEEFLKNVQVPEQKGAVLIVVAKNRLDFGKQFVPALLKSNNVYDIQVALRLIREYELVEYRREVQNLRQSKFESIVQEVDQTLSYLAARSPAQQ